MRNETKILLTSMVCWWLGSFVHRSVVSYPIVACWHASIYEPLRRGMSSISIFTWTVRLTNRSFQFIFFHFLLLLRVSLSWEECEIGAIIQNLLQCQRVYIILHNSISNIGCSVDWSRSTFNLEHALSLSRCRARVKKRMRRKKTIK